WAQRDVGEALDEAIPEHAVQHSPKRKRAEPTAPPFFETVAERSEANAERQPHGPRRRVRHAVGSMPEIRAERPIDALGWRRRQRIERLIRGTRNGRTHGSVDGLGH